eukprot:s1995_g8.t1
MVKTLEDNQFLGFCEKATIPCFVLLEEICRDFAANPDSPSLGSCLRPYQIVSAASVGFANRGDKGPELEIPIPRVQDRGVQTSCSVVRLFDVRLLQLKVTDSRRNAGPAKNAGAGFLALGATGGGAALRTECRAAAGEKPEVGSTEEIWSPLSSPLAGDEGWRLGVDCRDRVEKGGSGWRQALPWCHCTWEPFQVAMTTAGVWDPKQHGIDMKRKSSFSLLDQTTKRPMPGSEEIGEQSDKIEKLWKLMDTYEPNDAESIQKSFARHLEYSLACTRFNFTMQDAYRAAGLVLRDRLLESLNDTNAYYRKMDVKRGYYLSAEYLIGRHMQNAIANLDLEQPFKEAFHGLGMELEDLFHEEADPALGNGGLGRLAACFLDSMATLSLPCWGYGIRYSYGMFKQEIQNGRQVECPDFWIGDGCPFEIPRPDITYPVRLYGEVIHSTDAKGNWCVNWVGGEIVQAMAYDNPIPGFDTYNTNNLRLWRACPSKEFDLDKFSAAHFADSVESRRKAEDLSAVLYPNDATYEGKELRLRQQYFFVSASLQDLLREFIKRPNYKWSDLPAKVAVQMNDTHPTIAVAEMMRLLVDVMQVAWDEAWDLTTKCLNYTNHTVMPEALEKWPVEMIERMLPRHLQLIGELNLRWIKDLQAKYGESSPVIAALSIFEEGDIKKIRMGNLAIMGANKVNGVAAIHTEIIKKETFPEFYKYCCDIGKPDKIVNMTNGVTPRRWVHCANPALSAIFTKYLGSHEWLTDMTKLKDMLKFKEDTKLHSEWMEMKREAKAKLAAYVKEKCNLDIDEDALIDIQIKRIHEYKRQLMNILYVIHRYQELKSKSPGERAKAQKRVVLIGGKA